MNPLRLKIECLLHCGRESELRPATVWSPGFLFMTFALKLPLVADVSQTDLGAPLSQANPKPAGIFARAVVAKYPSINKAYQCIEVATDPSAVDVWKDAQANGVKFGVYAYILQGMMQQQIDAFINFCKASGFYANGKWQLDFPPVCDVEVECIAGATYYTAWANQIKQWLDAVEAALGIRPWIYTARPQWAWLLSGPSGDAPSWTKDYLFWLKFYPYDDWIDANVSFPISALPTGVTMEQNICWQYNDHGRGVGYQYNDLNVPTAAGMKYFSGGAVKPDIVKHIIEIDLSQNQLFITPAASDVLSLMTPLEQAKVFGWNGAMNCGAGFTYTDATHAQIKTTGFESLTLNSGDVVYYARKMITAGAINSNLDTTYQAPWSMLGFKNGKAYFIVSEGQEAQNGLTQMQTAQWGLSQGFTDLYLFDSGHSCGIAQNGQMIYSAYGEAVPQCIGFKAINGGSTMAQAKEKLGKTVTIRTSPEAISGNDSGQTFAPFATINYVGIVDDVQHPGDANYKWLDLGNGTFVNYMYPPAGQRFDLITVPSTPPVTPPPPATVTIAHTIDVNTDGSLIIDGKPYA